jgi:hypothetical protein
MFFLGTVRRKQDGRIKPAAGYCRPLATAGRWLLPAAGYCRPLATAGRWLLPAAGYRRPLATASRPHPHRGERNS